MCHIMIGALFLAANDRPRALTADAERVARNLARYERGVACCADARDVVP